MSLSALLITLNEEHNIEACLQSVRWADEIVMIDSGSADQTVAKAAKFTSRIYRNPFVNFADQKNTALRHATKDWVFFLDADERVSPELAKEMRGITNGNTAKAAYAVKRATYFFGKKLNFSGTQTDYPIRLFPRQLARFEQPVHEKVVTDLPLHRLKHELIHHSTRDFEHYRRKLKQYIPLEFETMKLKGRHPSFLDLIWRPPAHFFYLYFFKLGLLDGLAGLQFAALASFYDFLKCRSYFQSTELKKNA